MLEIIGRIHPFIIHLPIGIFVWALLVRFVFKKKEENSHSTLCKILSTVFYSSVLTALSGLAHATSYEGESDLINYHKIAGILFTVSIGFLLYCHKKETKDSTLYFAWFLSTALLFLTGDLGAKLTHGYNLFSIGSSINNSKTSSLTKTGIVYDDIIAPIFQAKCYSCHSSKKQKGNLRLDSRDHIKKGGKNGIIIDTIHPDKSEILQRIFLPHEEEDHMPPSGKSQLSDKELQILEWWIMKGANFHSKTADISEEERNTMGLEESHSIAISAIDKYQNVPTGRLNNEALQALIQKGYAISPLAQGSDLLQIRLRKSIAPDDSILWNKLAQNIVVLTVHDSILDMQQMRHISHCTNLVDLDLSNSNISDTLLELLKPLQSLQLLNIANTSCSVQGLKKLGSMPSINQIYLYNTNQFVSESIKTIFPNASIDTGNYLVSFLPGDTSFFTRTIYLKMLKEDSLNLQSAN